MACISFEDFYSIFENKIKKRQEEYAEEEKYNKEKITIELYCLKNDKNVLKNKFRTRISKKKNPDFLCAFSCFYETLLSKDMLIDKKPINNFADFYPIKFINSNGILVNPSFELGCILLNILEENGGNKTSIDLCKVELYDAYLNDRLEVNNLLETLSAFLFY